MVNSDEEHREDAQHGDHTEHEHDPRHFVRRVGTATAGVPLGLDTHALLPRDVFGHH